jgi:uncharacterized damage-inducible protein DinB
MEMLETLRKLFEYDAWANGEALASLRAAVPPPERALAALAHVAGAGEVWLSRVNQKPDTAVAWPDLGLVALEGRLKEVALRWRTYLDGLSARDLARPMTYRNTKGETFSYPLGDVLLHLVLHGTYHRGQVAFHLRSAGTQPPLTDYTKALRDGIIR